MPSLPSGAVAGAAGGKAQDQARRVHGAHGPQVPAAVVPGECRVGAACCWVRRGATQSQQQVLGMRTWHRRDGGEEEGLRQPSGAVDPGIPQGRGCAHGTVAPCRGTGRAGESQGLD